MLKRMKMHNFPYQQTKYFMAQNVLTLFGNIPQSVETNIIKKTTETDRNNLEGVKFYTPCV